MTDLLARRGWLLTVAVTLLAFALHWRTSLAHNKHSDFFVYRAGSVLGLEGRSPYDTAALRELAEPQYPGDVMLAGGLGFFLPPQTIVLLAPFALLPWGAAKVAFSAVSIGLGGWAAHRLPVFATGASWRRAGPLLAALALLNPVVASGLLPGQITLLLLSCVVLGEVAERSGWRWVAGLLWAVPFIKPHLALPLLPLAWYLGGWRRFGILAGWLAALNLAGCLVSTGSPWLLKDYLDYLAAGHKSVVFNRAEFNPQITSWNRLLIAAGGPVLELSAKEVLLGYAAWAGLVLLRVRLAGSRPTRAWAVAVAFAGAAICCQVMGYELALLALAIPHLLDLYGAGRMRVLVLLVAALLLASLSFPTVHAFAESLRGSIGDPAAEVIRSHRAVGAMLFALGVLAGGWPTVTPSTSS